MEELGNSGYFTQHCQGCLGSSDLTFLAHKHAGFEDKNEK